VEAMLAFKRRGAVTFDYGNNIRAQARDAGVTDAFDIPGFVPRSEQLAAQGIRTFRDLLEYPPFRYEDRTYFRPIDSLREGEWAVTRGRVKGIQDYQTRRRGFSIFQMLVGDSTGSILVKFFNQPYLSKVYGEGAEIVVYGQVRRDEYHRSSLCFHNPEIEILDREAGQSIHTGRVVPIYRKLGEL